MKKDIDNIEFFNYFDIEKYLSQKNKKILFEKAYNRDASILNDPNVSIYRNDRLSCTPLHELACCGCVEVLKHPDVDKVKDERGWTPLHYLAACPRIEVLHHPSVNSVRNDGGASPLDLFCYWNSVRQTYYKNNMNRLRFFVRLILNKK